MTNAELVARATAYDVPVFARFPVAFVRGEGCRVWDADGKRYLDFFAGLAVNNLGHAHPAVVEAIRAQAGRILHVSNYYHNVPAGELAELLCRHTFAERAFLCNSGAEANEAAMKLVRRWGADHGGGRYEILATIGSFHGRTFGTLTATGQEKYHRGFLPLLPGIRLVPYDDLDAMAAAIRDETIAKALGGGVPIGAMVTTARLAGVLTPGSHGTTFGGNPLAAAAAVAAVRALADPKLLEHARAMGARLREHLERLQTRHRTIRQVRGLGLMLAAELDRPGAAVVDRCLAAGLLLNCTAERVLRLTPPLVITADEIDEGVKILDEALAA